MLGALTVAPALAWNEVLKLFFGSYVKYSDRDKIYGSMIYAVIVSLIVVIIVSVVEPKTSDDK
jgi:glucose uptake protein GlcU